MSWLGIVSCTVAGVFICVGQAAGRRSRLLRDAKQVGSLAGGLLPVSPSQARIHLASR